MATVGKILQSTYFRCRCSLSRTWTKHTRSVYTRTHHAINDDLYGFNEDQKQLRQTAFNFLQKELAPKFSELEENDQMEDLRGFWKKAGDLGLHGITVPTESGGAGLGYLEHVLVTEEIARASPAIASGHACHANLCINQIVRNGNEEQKAKYLPKLISGEHIGALAMSEPSAGSDVVSMKCTAEKQGDHFVLNGTKTWISNGPDADIIIVYAKTETQASKRQHGITAFIIEKTMPGYSAFKIKNKFGVKGMGFGELHFENVEIPVENVLKEVNKGVYVLFSGLDIERIILSSVPLGIMQAACDIAFEYAHEREAFGEKIGMFQMIQGKMADMYTKLNVCRSYIYNVARALDAGKIVPKDCASAFLLAADSAMYSASESIQILGGNGYVEDYQAGSLLRDAKAFDIAGGTKEIRRLVVGREINAEYGVK